MQLIIVGLGNPGEEYELTRHNVGRIVLDHLQKKIEGSDWKKDLKTGALISKGELEGEKVLLLKPENFMNRSGNALKEIITSEKKAERLVVIYDDLDLPFGTMKLSFNRGSGGHRGLESIIRALKTEKFIRIRVGISPSTTSGKIRKPKGEAAVEKHILGQFKKAELDVLKIEAKKISESLNLLVSSGLAYSMTWFNQS